MPRLAFAALALCLFAGCDAGTEPSDLTDVTLTLQDAVLPASSDIDRITPSTITFAPNGQVDVASCNTCQGTYAWDSNELIVTGLGCTEIGCGSNLDLGDWLVAERVIASDADDENITFVAERDGQIATFVFTIAER